MRKGYCLSILAAAAVSLMPIPLSALPDPCLVVYPEGPCIYHYDPDQYYTVTPGDSLYDPAYDRGGEVLIDINTNEIDPVVYQPPNLTGFEMATDGNDGYFTVGNSFDLIIDGWSNEPTTYHNIQLVFEADPSFCVPTITVRGDPVSGPPFVYAVGDLVVSTPTPDGNNYSDTLLKHVEWAGC